MIKDLKLGQVVVIAADENAWLEKKVKNPKTGNTVKVKSLPPKEQEKYRPKKKKAKDDSPGSKFIPKKEDPKAKQQRVKEAVKEKLTEVPKPFADPKPKKKAKEVKEDTPEVKEKKAKKKSAKEAKFKEMAKDPKKHIATYKKGLKDLGLDESKIIKHDGAIADSYDLVKEYNQAPTKEARAEVKQKAKRMADDLDNWLSDDDGTPPGPEHDEDFTPNKKLSREEREPFKEHDREEKRKEYEKTEKTRQDNEKKKQEKQKEHEPNPDLFKYNEETDDWNDGGFFAQFFGTMLREAFDDDYDHADLMKKKGESKEIDKLLKSRRDK